MSIERELIMNIRGIQWGVSILKSIVIYLIDIILKTGKKENMLFFWSSLQNFQSTIAIYIFLKIKKKKLIVNKVYIFVLRKQLHNIRNLIVSLIQHKVDY